MASWYSKILTTTTSRISGLLGGDADGDTEDDTHVCRVLRAYYTEKGRQFPGWLPPDPKAPPPVAPVYAPPAVGSRYGGLAQDPGGGSGLSSLWEKNPPSQRQDAPTLRQGRGAPPPRGSDAAASGRPNPYARNNDPRDDVQARPLPSQRAGSYQNANLYGGRGTDSSSTPPGTAAGGSAQDRLRNRLFGGGARSASPASQSPFPPPQPQSSGSGASYGRNAAYSSGGNGSYEDRFAPSGAYDAPGRGGDSDKPFMAANAPWATNEDEFSGGGGGGGGRTGGGLPSGPRRAGGGGGLPSGPRRR